MSIPCKLLPFVVSFVIFAHLALGSFLYFQSSWISFSSKVRSSKIVVQTVVLTPSIKKIQASPLMKVEQKAPDSKKEASPTIVEKKTVSSIKKEIVKKSPTPTATKKVELKQDGEKQRLLAAAQEKIASIQTVPHPVSINRIEATTQSKDASPSKELGGQGSYADVLMDRLRKSLQLPEYGRVDMELTLDRSGKVLKLKILSDESRKNRQYIEKMVPQLKFASFGMFFSGESSHSFVVSLHNDL